MSRFKAAAFLVLTRDEPVMSHDAPSNLDHLWLLLSLIPALGPSRLKAFGQTSWTASSADAALRLLKEEDLGEARKYLSRVLEWAAAPGNALLPLYSPDYPPLLKNLSDPPSLLYLRGNKNALNLPQIAIVGTRKPSADGRRLAREFGAALAQRGYVVTSGMALGVDAESHHGALEAGGLTVAVLGSGLDQLYPKSNRALAERIQGEGLLVSEFPPWQGPQDWHFPVRNRIISGLSHGVLVVEAAARSGSLITARLAAEQGREVFAIPGSVYNPLSRGCHALLRSGAKLVERVEDILEELPALTAWERERLDEATSNALPATVRSSIDECKSSLSEEDRRLLDLIGFGEVSLEQLSTASGLPVATLLARLGELELRGLLSSSPAGFSRAG